MNSRGPGNDASLCHGLAGLLDIVLRLVGNWMIRRVCRPGRHVARVLIDRHGHSVDYPSGLVSGSVNPSLMLGLAGTGYAFLRLHAPEQVPSVLLIGCRGP